MGKSKEKADLYFKKVLEKIRARRTKARQIRN
jgi:hypothetical protein